jgi:outer membrane protein assembly factor BamD
MNKHTSFSHTLLAAAVFLFLLGLFSCDTPERLMKSNDNAYKEKKAIQWYNKKDYFKAIPVFEELMGVYKGQKRTDTIYYYYCMSNFKQGDYILAAYHFKNFTDLFPNSDKNEECLYMHAKSYDKLSPKWELEQTYTYKALEAYMLFLNNYPESKYVDTCNKSIYKIRKKLEKKALAAAELYYKTSNYKAAATTFAVLPETFPDIDNLERIYFMIEKSYYELAKNSVSNKKEERYRSVIESYKNFVYKYPGSKYNEEAKILEQKAHFGIVQGLLEHGQAVKIEEREKFLALCMREAEIQKPLIEDEYVKKRCDIIAEQAAFLIVKYNYQISEERKGKEKLQQLEQTVKTYYTFAAQFKDGRHAREAERLYNSAYKGIEKLKANG